MKKKESRKATVIALSDSEIYQILNWLRLNKALKSIGEVQKIDNGYAVKVRSKISKSALSDLAKGRFGVFVKIV